MSVTKAMSIYNQGVSMSQVNSAISEATSQLATGYTPKGPASVATLNGLTGHENGWLYTMTDAGTLTDGSLAVVAGDTVAWDATNEVWYKAMDYAPRKYGTNEVYKLPTIATEADLVASNYLAINGSAVTKRLPADIIGNKLGKKTTTETDLNNITENGIYSVSTSMSNYPTGAHNGMLVVFNATANRKLQLLAESMRTSGSISKLYYRCAEYTNNTWSKWEKIVTPDNINDAARDSQIIIVFRNLLANTDMNDCTDAGYYSLNTQYTWTNVPSGWTYGFVVVYSLPGRCLQVAYNQGTGDVWQRSCVSGAWGSWQRINGSDEKCSIKYDSANTWQITFGDFKVNLIHAVNAVNEMDTYNLSKITDKAGNVICPQGTDIIGPAKIDGEVDFIGGVHGYETATSVKIVCDGVVQTLDSSLDTTANEINIFIETSDISHVSLSEVWTREIAITIKKNEILVSSKYTITSPTDITIFRMTNGGLMAAYHDDLGSAWMPNKILSPIPTTSISNASEKNTICEFNTKYGTIRVENIVGHELATYKGWWQNFQNETPKRLKSYFDLINGNTIVHNGDVFVGVAKYTMTPKV